MLSHSGASPMVEQKLEAEIVGELRLRECRRASRSEVVARGGS